MRPASERIASKRRRRGSVLIAALIGLIVLLIFGAALIRGATASLHNASRERDRVVASNLAESGTELGLRWLRDQPYPPGGTDTIRPTSLQNVALDSGTISVDVIPYPDNAGRTLKGYYVVGKGSTPNAYQRRIAYQAQEESFAEYAYFTREERSPVATGAIWFIWADYLDGRVHSNDQFRISWRTSNPPDPIFAKRVTTAADAPFYSPDPTTPEDYSQIFQDGQAGISTNVDYIPMPQNMNTQRDAAWAGSSGFPTTTGPYLRSTQGGGLYIKGAVDSMVFSSTATQTQATITQMPSSTTKIVATYVEDYTLNQTSLLRINYNKSGSKWVEASRTNDVQPGLPNGVIYCDNAIGGVQGVVGGRHTLACASGKDVTITGNLTLANNPNTNPNATDVLGIVAQNVVLDKPSGDLTVQAVMFAGGETSSGSIYNKYWDTSPRQQSAFHLLGGLLQAQRGPVGTFNPSTGAIVSGYTKDYHYDTRLSDIPPPYFPTTGKFVRVGWQKV